MTDLFGPLFGSPTVDSELSDAAWVGALVQVEAALANAAERVGHIQSTAADAIRAACWQVGETDPAELGSEALGAGNPVPALVSRISAAVGDDAAPYVHFGATSQDILDTALMLLVRRAGRAILADLAEAADATAVLAERHRDTVAAARTLGQQAVPTTFGRRAAGWLVAVDEMRERLAAVLADQLAVQYGGAAGTLAATGAAGRDVGRLLAAELSLAVPTLPWHADRSRIAEIGAALAAVIGAFGKDRY